MSIRMIVVASALLLSCSATPGAHPLGASPNGTADAMRFAVLPVNALVPLSRELSDASERVLGQITRYLQVQGHRRQAIELSQTHQLWRDSVAEVDADESRSNDFVSAMKVFARKLGETVGFDALVVGSLVYREARLSRRQAKWDGVIRRISDRADESLRVPESYAGTVSAVSLLVMVFDASGERIFANYGGIDLAHSLSLAPGEEEALIAEVRSEVLEEHRVLREGVELAFEPYFPRPRSADW